MAKMKCVLLIDDNEADNYLHELVLLEAGVVETVFKMRDGESALAFLQTLQDGAYPNPEIIFLDINMPKLTGWEFLEAYEALEPEMKGGKVVVMLTTSFNPEDQQRADQHGMITSFRRKPLTAASLELLLSEAFPSRFSPTQQLS